MLMKRFNSLKGFITHFQLKVYNVFTSNNALVGNLLGMYSKSPTTQNHPTFENPNQGTREAL